MNYMRIAGLSVFFIAVIYLLLIILGPEEEVAPELERVAAPKKRIKNRYQQKGGEDKEQREIKETEEKSIVSNESWRNALLEIKRRVEELDQDCQQTFDELYPDVDIVDPDHPYYTDSKVIQDDLVRLTVRLENFYEQLEEEQALFFDRIKNSGTAFDIDLVNSVYQSLDICKHHSAGMFIETVPEAIGKSKFPKSFGEKIEESYLNLALLLISRGPPTSTNFISALGMVKLAASYDFFREQDINQLDIYYGRAIEIEKEFLLDLERIEQPSEAKDFFTDAIDERMQFQTEVFEFLIDWR